MKTIIKKVKVILMTTIYLQPKYSLKAKQWVEEKLKSRQSRHLYSKVILAVIRTAEMLSNKVALLPPDSDDWTYIQIT